MGPIRPFFGPEIIDHYGYKEFPNAIPTDGSKGLTDASKRSCGFTLTDFGTVRLGVPGKHKLAFLESTSWDFG